MDSKIGIKNTMVICQTLGNSAYAIKDVIHDLEHMCVSIFFVRNNTR
jgi:hypothetical protein